MQEHSFLKLFPLALCFPLIVNLDKDLILKKGKETMFRSI